MITFNLVPNDIRVPGSYVEFDASKALSGMPSVPLKILVIGQRLATGAVAALTPVRITNAAEAVAAFGRGSMLAMGIAALKAVNDKTECWAIGLADDGAAVAAAGTITVTGPATAAGTIALYIGGKRLTIGVASGDTANAIAAAIEAKIDADLDLPVTAAVAGAVVTVTARNKGTAGNDIDIRHSYYQGEGLPAGTGLAIVAMAAGATNPDVGTVWPVIGDERFDFVVLPFADAATLNTADAEMERRSGPQVAVDGVAVAGYRGTLGNALALGTTRNCEFTSIVASKSMPTHPFAFACAYYGVVAYHAAIDPARPFQTLTVSGIVPPLLVDRFTAAEREQLLRDGLSTFTVDADGSVRIERPVTTYQTNPQALDDPSWLDLNIPLLLAAIRRVWRIRYSTRYPRHKLANDGAAFGSGQAVITPRAAAAENVSIYRDLEEAGWVDDIEGFKRDQLVERDATDRSRLNMLLPVRLIGAFRVMAAKIEYRL
jgi:phage tail sheath gpL-like